MEPAHTLGKIMIVDDDPADLKLLEDMFRGQDYEVRSFPRGRLALAAAGHESPDLFLLDIEMPEMNGYEICMQLKASPLLSTIPVIFISARHEIDHKSKGFQSGGVDYISKPFHLLEVHARVETHLQLRRAQQLERELLDKTLGGAVGVLWELVQVISPALALRSAAIRDIALWVTKRMEIPDAWQCELAATLCLLGCMALPDHVFDKAYCGRPLTPDEDRMFQAHPESAARLLANIPRLEVVAEMIRGQQGTGDAPFLEEARQGAELLRLALELDRRIWLGVAPAVALTELRSSARFDGRILVALENYSPTKTAFKLRRLKMRDLASGMVLDHAIVSKDGNLLIMKEGTILTEIWIERLRNFAKSGVAGDEADVRLPLLFGPRLPDNFGRVPHAGARKPQGVNL